MSNKQGEYEKNGKNGSEVTAIGSKSRLELFFAREPNPLLPQEGAWLNYVTPFILNSFDLMELQKISGLTIQEIEARGYFSFPEMPAAVRLLRESGFTDEQIKSGHFIGVPVRNQWGELQRYHLLRMDGQDEKRGDATAVLMPHRFLGNHCTYGCLPEDHLLDVSPMSYRNLDEGANTIVYTDSPLGADSAASRGMVGVALPTKDTSTLRFQHILRYAYSDVLNLGSGFEHVFVIDAESKADESSTFSLNASRLMHELRILGESVREVKISPFNP